MSCSTEAGTTPEWSIFGGEFSQKSQLALTEAVLVCHIHIYTCVHNYYDCVVYPYFQRYNTYVYISYVLLASEASPPTQQ